MYKRTALCAIC